MGFGLERATAETIAQEYVKLLDEGWQPDLEEFLNRVPDELREEAFELIDRELAHRQTADEEQLPAETPERVVIEPDPAEAQLPAEAVDRVVIEPAPPEPVADRLAAPAPTKGGDGWIRLAARVVAYDIRNQWLGEHLADRADARALGFSRFEMTLLSGPEVLNAIAQHAPLRSEDVADPPGGCPRWTGPTALAWRLAGPCLFLGVLVGAVSLLAAAALLLVSTYVGLAAVHRSGRWGAAEVRLANRVFAGTLVALGATIAIGFATAVVMGLAVLVGWSGLVSAAPVALVLLTTLTLCTICLSGWAPQPWYPKRLIRI